VSRRIGERVAHSGVCKAIPDSDQVVTITLRWEHHTITNNEGQALKCQVLEYHFSLTALPSPSVR
jgi:hypothetical protein